MLPTILMFIQENRDDIHPAIVLYFDLYHLILDSQKDTYFTIRKSLKSLHSVLPKRDLRDMYVFMQNFCIRRSNLGEVEFLRELFELYKTLIESKIIIDEDFMPLSDFKNIATTGLRLGEIKWVNDFTEEYVHFLDPMVQESAKAFNLARIHFLKQEFKQTIQQLIQVDFKDDYYRLGARSLLIRVYFERKEVEILEANIQSFQKFLDRNESLSEYQKKPYLNFIKALHILIQLHDKKDIGEKNRRFILEEKNIVSREWILSKAQNL